MTVTALKRHLDEVPFKPFDLITASGKSYHVPHPDFLTFSPTGRICNVYGDEDYFTALDVLTITELVQKPARPKRARNRRLNS